MSRLTRDAKFITLAILVGLLSALGSALFRALLGIMTELFMVWGRALLAGMGSMSVMLLPALGGLLVGVLNVWLVRDEETYGVARIIEAVALRGGRLRPRPALVRVAASIITLGSGGSAGLQDPNVHIGAVVGSTLAQWAKLPTKKVKALVGCGAAAGIAATFNAPIAGVFFALEAVLGRFSSSALGFVMLASVTASVLSRALQGNAPLFEIEPFVFQAWEVVPYLGLGALTALVAVGYARLLQGMGHIFQRIKWAWTRPALGGLVVGAMALGFPQLFGTGLPYLSELLGQSLNTVTWQQPMMLLAILALLKPFATAVTLGSGGAGGIFAPALFVGATLGGAYGLLLQGLLPGRDVAAVSYALVGMGGLLAGTIHAPLTSILFLFELTQDYHVILPIMLCGTVSYGLARYLKPTSIYTQPLLERGINLERVEGNPMERVQVHEVMRPDVARLERGVGLDGLVHAFASSDATMLPVVDEQGQLAGVVLREAYQRALDRSSPVNLAELILERPPTVFADESLDDALRLLGAQQLSALPVISRTALNQVVGMIYSRDIIAAYNRALSRQVLMERKQEAQQVASRQGGALLQVTLDPGSAIVGKTVVQLGLPQQGATILYIKRDGQVVMPHGNTLLLPQDELVIELEEPTRAPFVRAQLERGHVQGRNVREFLKEYALPALAPAVGKRIEALQLPSEWLVVRVQRGDEVFVPHGSMLLQAGDRVTVFGLAEETDAVEQCLLGGLAARD